MTLWIVPGASQEAHRDSISLTTFACRYIITGTAIWAVRILLILFLIAIMLTPLR
jgi:hypothetical protein